MKFFARFASDRYCAWFRRMLQLTMTARLSNDFPAIGFQNPQDIPDFHILPRDGKMQRT